ncbi:MAG: right-handed parallel beta-helix repeat-containing protein [Sedimentisphaeraceae bacterium JB056]
MQHIKLYVSVGGNDQWSGQLPQATIEKNDGPLMTIEAARDKIRQIREGSQEPFSATVFIREGLYELNQTVVFGLEDSGEGNCRISYEAYPDEKPVLTGSTQVTGWKPLNHSVEGLSEEAAANIWIADIPEGIENFKALYASGKSLSRARGKGFKPTVSGFWEDAECWEKGSRTQLHFPEGALKNWRNIEDVEIVIRPWCLWTMNILPLKSVDEENCIANTGIEGSYFLTRERYFRFPDECVWAENIPEGMTAPLRWMVNTQSRTIYLWSKDGKKPENITIPRLRELIKVEGKIREDQPTDIPATNISFKNLAFTQGDRDSWTNDHKGVQHDWEMWDEGNALLRLRGAENCEVIDCDFNNSAGSGIRLDLHCQYNRIEGNHIGHLGATGIFLGGYGAGTKNVNNKNQIRNNHIHDCGQIYWHASGIAVHQSGENTIAHNLLYNLPYSGIVVVGIRPGFLRKEVREAILSGNRNFDRSFIPIKENMRTQSIREICSHVRWNEVTVVDGLSLTDEMTATLPFIHTRSNIIEYNEIHDIMQVLGDGNGIYISDCGPYNVLRYNRIYNMTHAFGVGIRTDAWQRDTLVEGNIIHDCRGGLAVSANNLALNNIVAFIRSTGLEGQKEGETDREVFSPIYYHLDRADGFNDGTIQRNICYHEGEYPVKFNLEMVDKNSDTPKQLVDFNIFFWKDEDDKCKSTLEDLHDYGYDKNSIVADPLFADAEARDFRLRPDSKALTLGIRSLPQDKMGLEAK